MMSSSSAAAIAGAAVAAVVPVLDPPRLGGERHVRSDVAHERVEVPTGDGDHVVARRAWSPGSAWVARAVAASQCRSRTPARSRGSARRRRGTARSGRRTHRPCRGRTTTTTFSPSTRWRRALIVPSGSRSMIARIVSASAATTLPWSVRVTSGASGDTRSGRGSSVRRDSRRRSRSARLDPQIPPLRRRSRFAESLEIVRQFGSERFHSRAR